MFSSCCTGVEEKRGYGKAVLIYCWEVCNLLEPVQLRDFRASLVSLRSSDGCYVRKLRRRRHCVRMKTRWLLFLTVTAGVSVSQAHKGCIIRGIMSKDVHHCLSFVFFIYLILCAWLSVVSTAPQTPFKAHSRQFLGFSLAISFRAKVPVICLDNTDSGGASGSTRLDAQFLLLDYGLFVIYKWIRSRS